MRLVDSHCHLDCLDLSADENDLSKVIKRAEQVGVSHFLCVCITHEIFPTMQAKVAEYPNVFLSVGTHPNEKATQEPTVANLQKLANSSKVVAIGETGLDYYRTEGDVEWQQQRFRHHIQAAKNVAKPLIVHSRNARADTIRILQEESGSEVGGVLHCFTENWEMARQALEIGFYISFSGIITFANANELREVAKKVPLNRILIETDSPYLAPIPMRGKSNQPAYVHYVAEKLAEIRSESLEDIAEQTTQNFFTLFKEARMQ
jgi:TatD DNase family protein